MATLYLLGWWYGAGWAWILRAIQKRMQLIQEAFSVSILLKTWFSPWKQIQSPSSFRNFLQSAIDNLISRFIGATVRTGMLLTALILTTLTVIGGIIVAVSWPLLPLLVIFLPVAFLSGMEL
jgi:hypothetical protein